MLLFIFIFYFKITEQTSFYYKTFHDYLQLDFRNLHVMFIKLNLKFAKLNVMFSILHVIITKVIN